MKEPTRFADDIISIAHIHYGNLVRDIYTTSKISISHGFNPHRFYKVTDISVNCQRRWLFTLGLLALTPLQAVKQQSRRLGSISRFFKLNTEKFYTEVQEIILARYNKTFDWALKAKMMGKKAIEAARVFVEDTGLSDSLTAEDFLVEREAMLQKLFPSSELMPVLRVCVQETWK
ncbi:(DL)-glycerol-3-phosphatase 1, mitochondrial-like [Rosa rugosa]|uniref:(DL)-glycerol-3-phosphatase 1, mitochondrial-like n=1 Tax=Rosa rugosa TaxID=74645 RepID=UPI002B40D3AC|nr:(DL)-glycerol-3-phosphatase 1, mitochondrial-like [Rosa rugosa]